MLIAPLDWGLGHATRCVPVIGKLLFAGFKVVIAAEGDQKILLQSIFPSLEIVELQGYRIRYASTKVKTIAKIFFQIPKILIAINRENRWLQRLLQKKRIDVVVSDNRFGLHHHNTTTIFITHQLHIKTGFGERADAMLQKLNYYFIRRFNYCWVPDAAGSNNLAGNMSHPLLKPATKLVYTGTLSAIKKEAVPLTIPLLLLLSGPEPQRSIFENILLGQLKNYQHPVVLVRGLPAATTMPAQLPASVTAYNCLSGSQLGQIMNAAGIIICRSGYSTLMDLLPMGKKCIVVPTPGQAEQEYLAASLSALGYVCAASQPDFLLEPLLAVAEALQLPDLSFLEDENMLEEAVHTLVAALDENKRPQAD